MSTYITILSILFVFYLIFELGGIHFLIREYYKNKFSEERFRNLLRLNKVDQEEAILFMRVYKLIANTDPCEYNVHNNDRGVERVFIRNVDFLCDYSPADKQYSLLTMIFYQNPKKDNQGTAVDMLMSRIQIGDFIIGFIMHRLNKYWDDHIKEERQKITDKYHTNISEVNKFF